jgi:3-deoxy-manno-octulosonate cytidylyltransferase (CMP-KDO synthetase)
MKVAGIIPARFASTRFPGKPLALIHGRSMIERVYKNASMAASLATVVVATDDQRIFDHVAGFGGRVVMTSPDHPSGTDRCAEAAGKLTGDFDVIINIQGDEPYLRPGQIDLLTSCFDHPETQIATLVKRITTRSELENVNIPKVVRDRQGRALYFSRSQVPYSKPSETDHLVAKGTFFKHIGIYGYRLETLKSISKLRKGILESAESLEQLRWLESGYSIYSAISEHDNHAVDVPGDVEVIEKLFPID